VFADQQESSPEGVKQDDCFILMPQAEDEDVSGDERLLKKNDGSHSQLTIRYFDFSSVFDSLSKKSYSLSSDLEFLSQQPQSRSSYFFPLKYKP